MEPHSRILTAGARALAGVGVAELALARSGRSALDGLGEVVIDRMPVPAVELGVRVLGVADKPLLRLQSLATLVAGGAVVGAGLGWGRHDGPGRSTAAAGVGLASLGLARRWLAQQRPVALDALAETSAPGPPLSDGADGWPGVAELMTPLEDFYVTDVTMRAPVVDVTDWRLEVVDASGATAYVDAAGLASLELRERDGLLVCVHNRPGWDRLGQQRWVGLPVAELISSLGLEVPEVDADLDLVMTGADGLVITLSWAEVVSRGSWVVTGMGGRPLSAAHGHPARVMTPGLPGQYSGTKWVTGLRLAPAGEVAASWEARGWPRGPVVVPLMARIDSPGVATMPPRLTTGRVRVPTRLDATGVAWAPAHGGVGGVDLRLDDGPWQQAELAADQGADCWRRWRLGLELTPGDHELAVRCRAHDGTVQAGTGRPPFPQGADGFHRVKVRAGA